MFGPQGRGRSRGHRVAHPDLPFSGPSNLKRPNFCACGRLGRQRAGNVFSPESTEDAEGHQEHHQGGAVAHGVHDLQLQQVLVLQRQACLSPSHRLAGLFSASSGPARAARSFDTECCAPRTSVPRLGTPWLWKRSRGSSYANSNYDPMRSAPYHHPEFEPLLEYPQGIQAHRLLRKSSGRQRSKRLDNFFSCEAKIYYIF